MVRAAPVAEPIASAATEPTGLPPGVLALAAEQHRQADSMADRAGLQPPTHDDRSLHRHLLEELTAPTRLERWPAPTEPRVVEGGWIHDDVVDDDRPAFEAVLADWQARGPEAVARAAQDLRWPVTPYRPLPRVVAVAGPPTLAVDDDTPPRSGTGSPRAGRPVRVIDLSSHWAGPLATSLLARAGAEVMKVDPACRPDGFRSRPALYEHLNGAKEIVDLDLRHDEDRDRFEALVAEADLLFESFSRRVLPNLGYRCEVLAGLNPDLGIVSIKAFPASEPERDWLAYGPGVHAASGLGLLSGRATPAPLAYPDLLAGVAAYAAAVGLAAGRRPAPACDQPPLASVEVSLAASIGPLVTAARSDRDPVETEQHG